MAGAATADRDSRVRSARSPAGRSAAAHRPLGGLRHRRAPLARPAGRRAVPDHPRTRVSRDAGHRFAARCTASTASTLREGDRVGVLRRAPHLRPLPRLHSPPHADALCAAPRLRHHRFGGRGAVRRMVAGRSTSSRASASRGCPTRVSFDDYIGGGCGLLTAVHIIERAALRPGDTRPGAGHRRRRPERHRAGPARWRVDDRRHRRPAGAPGARARRWAPTTRSIWTRTTPEERLASRARADPRRGRRRRDRSRRLGARRFEEGLDLARVGGRYVIAGHYTDVGPSTINAHHQINRKHLEIRGCWGSEAGSLPPRAARFSSGTRR